MEKKDILSVAVDAVKGSYGQYSEKQTSDELRAAFIELNGGSTKINPKTFYRGTALFDLVEELIPVIINEGIVTEGNPLFNLVEYRNLAEGDEAEFETEGEANFVVASAAEGILKVRRQRITNGELVTVNPKVYNVRVYEELDRLLAGRIDFGKFVDGVAKAFKNYIAEMAYAAISGLSGSTAGLDASMCKTGSVTEDTLLALCEHVEAATGQKPMIYGTITALRKALGSAVTYSAERNADLYNRGYIGRLGAYEVVQIPQAHKQGTYQFSLADDELFVVGANDKPIKVVNRGEGMLYQKNAEENADLTQEYIYGQAFGVAALCAAQLGHWTEIV